MSWEKEIEELRRRETLAQRMGGPDKVKRQHDGGKLTVRERVERLLDAGSFHEIGGLAGVATYGTDGQLAELMPANLIFGRGRIGGRLVAVTGDDFTVRGGANDGGIKNKLLAVERMACDLRLPLVRLVDGTGGGGSVKNLEIHGHSPMPKAFLWDWWTDNLSEIPVVSLALGSVAGLGAARVVASHYSVMVKDSSQMFVAGPPVVEWTHGKFEKNELGGSHIHTRNGAVDEAIGELVGFMAVINSASRANNARAREAVCLLEIPRAAFLEIYNGTSGAAVSLQHAIHRSLLRSIAAPIPNSLASSPTPA